jgi:hypothetical protein
MRGGFMLITHNPVLYIPASFALAFLPILLKRNWRSAKRSYAGAFDFVLRPLAPFME